MKNFTLLILLFSMGCTRKYTGYDLIRKVDFQRESYQRPTTLMEVLPEGKDELDACFNQWLFFVNAEKEKEQAIPMIVRSLCPGQDYLLNAEMVEQWWTTLVFTRSCVTMKTSCGVLKK
jgi:hypothetical protein